MKQRLAGTWKVQELLRFNDHFECFWSDREEVMADRDLDEAEKWVLQLRIVFFDDGRMQWLMPLPEKVPPEEIRAAVQSGELTLYDEKTMLIEEHPWQWTDGKLMYDTGRPAAGKEMSFREEIPEENGMLRVGRFRLTKA